MRRKSIVIPEQSPLPEAYNRIHTLLPSGRPIWVEVPGRLTAEDKEWLVRLIDLFLVIEVRKEGEENDDS